MELNIEWAKNLKVGDKIDVLKEEREGDLTVRGWAVAKIENIFGDVIYVSYDGFSPIQTESYIKTETKVSPLGSKIDDWEWRATLKEGSQIDIFDTQGKWFLGTVLKTSTEVDEMKMLYVGFRVYLHTGIKLDDDNKKYEGWSSQYDAWIPAYSIRIQK